MKSVQLRNSSRFSDGVARMVRLKNPLLQHGSYNVMMSSGESSSPVQTISSTGFDVPDEARLAKITPTTTPSPTTSTKTSKADNETTTADADVEAIEEATPIVQKTLPVSESTYKIERNGFDMDTTKTLNDHEEPDMCLINCIYYTQQCCTCTIL
ncbi:uncharacterized protein LOC116843764 isoform X3 [Odontomachus brunneus]|uniref:uncharacterized protein LOC116843764 isoform X3 n=1 Tax=Odontomachus brunneus TaxID=486640 RepID=UPI0013F1F058|nr:uncharacterized protein LOC116843764 isoform X3 [Odontomachus brunneus]